MRARLGWMLLLAACNAPSTTPPEGFRGVFHAEEFEYGDGVAHRVVDAVNLEFQVGGATKERTYGCDFENVPHSGGTWSAGGDTVTVAGPTPRVFKREGSAGKLRMTFQNQSGSTLWAPGGICVSRCAGLGPGGLAPCGDRDPWTTEDLGEVADAGLDAGTAGADAATPDAADDGGRGPGDAGCADEPTKARYASCLATSDEPGCTSQGGTWVKASRAPDAGYACSCPTGQGACPCTTTADCLGGCTNTTVVAGPMDSCEGIALTCDPTSRPVLGCHCRYWYADKVEPVCVD